MCKKIIHHEKIYHADSNFREEIGYMQLIQCEKFRAHELEYYLDEKYRGKGLMVYALTSYLKKMREEKGIKALIALVEDDNLPSQRVLEKLDFFKFMKIRNIETYLKILN